MKLCPEGRFVHEWVADMIVMEVCIYERRRELAGKHSV
jgi:hypothetical protein